MPAALARRTTVDTGALVAAVWSPIATRCARGPFSDAFRNMLRLVTPEPESRAAEGRRSGPLTPAAPHLPIQPTMGAAPAVRPGPYLRAGSVLNAGAMA